TRHCSSPGQSPHDLLLPMSGLGPGRPPRGTAAAMPAFREHRDRETATMRALKTLTIAALVTALPIAATAADAITYPVSSAAAMPVYDGPAFDWNGFYAGVFGGAQSSTVNGMQYGGGVALGFNAAFDFFLVGAE